MYVPHSEHGKNPMIMYYLKVCKVEWGKDSYYIKMDEAADSQVGRGDLYLKKKKKRCVCALHSASYPSILNEVLRGEHEHLVRWEC